MRRVLLLIAAATALAAAGCKESELLFGTEKGVYRGKQDEALSAETTRVLRDRTTLQNDL